MNKPSPNPSPAPEVMGTPETNVLRCNNCKEPMANLVGIGGCAKCGNTTFSGVVTVGSCVPTTSLCKCSVSVPRWINGMVFCNTCGHSLNDGAKAAPTETTLDDIKNWEPSPVKFSDAKVECKDDEEYCDRAALEAAAEDGLLVSWDKDYRFPFSQVVRLMAAFAIEHRGSQPDPWVDVKVGLPTSSHDVLIAYVDENVDFYVAGIGHFSEGKQWHHSTGSPAGNVTHWRELPAPPETRATEGK